MNFPKHGTAPIRCGIAKCSWRGFETDLRQVPGKIEGVSYTMATCPKCGCDSYSFMTDGEIKAWERKKAKDKGGPT
jgi:hypothetical protein